MYVFGELRDPKRAQDVVNHLRGRGMSVGLQHIPQEDLYVLYVDNEKDVPWAQDAFCTFMGFPKPVEIPREWHQIKSIPMGSVTKYFLIFSVLVFLGSFLDDKKVLWRFLFMSEIHKELFFEIKKGEIWRLFTPVFIHFNFIHILFNLMWFKDLGSIMEYTKGMKFYLLLFSVLAIFPNLGQYLAMGPSFGGMSGVVYGLLGFLWMNKTFHPNTEFALPKHDVIMMIIWFFLCLSGVIGNIANVAHAVGLSIGMLFGIYSGCMESQTLDLRRFVVYVSISILITMATAVVEYMKLGMKFYFMIHHYLQ